MQRDRVDKLHRIGCIACRKIGIYSQIDIHHLVEGYRLGDEYTLPLCPWHHRGVPPDNWSKADAENKYGPSLAHAKKAFKLRFGSERQLHEEVETLS